MHDGVSNFVIDYPLSCALSDQMFSRTCILLVASRIIADSKIVGQADLSEEQKKKKKKLWPFDQNL